MDNPKNAENLQDIPIEVLDNVQINTIDTSKVPQEDNKETTTKVPDKPKQESPSFISRLCPLCTLK